jgi:DNA repair exonuclease SbcCD ATPase subunit
VAALPSEGQLLLVEADPDQALRLKQELRGRQQVAVCAEVLAQQSGTPLRWYAFNDPRLNGPLDEQAWRERYPNLRRIGEEQRIGRRLEEVLNAWARQQQGSPEPLTLSLQLRQGDPLVALEGLGRWIAALQSVQLVMPAAREIWGQSVQAWLADRGFEAVEELAAPTWRRDPLATQRLQLQQKEQQIAELEEQLASQAVRLLLGQTRHEELQGQLGEQSEQRAALGVRCEELQVRCEELEGQRDVFLAERDNLQEQLRGQQQQTSEQSQQRVELQEQVETLQGQLSAQSAQTSEQSQQREALGVRCEELQTLLSAQQAANSQLQSDREVLAKERDEWRGKAEAQEGRLQAINQELDEILALLDAGTTDSPAADVEPIGQTD